MRDTPVTQEINQGFRSPVTGIGIKTNITAKDALITKEITRILEVLCQEPWADTNMSIFYYLTEFIHVVMYIRISFFFFCKGK